jgi:uncharacterized protein (TIGR02757 family)
MIVVIDLFPLRPHAGGDCDCGGEGMNFVGAGPCACPDDNDGIGQPQGVAPTTILSLSDVIHRFKTLTTKQYIDGVRQHGWKPFQGKLWQRNYYEHIIRDEKEMAKIREYIINNPLNWETDENFKLLPESSSPNIRIPIMSLKHTLDRLYNTYNFKDRILHDPIEFPHQYKRPEDMEVSSLIASCFAYGRVDLFKPVVKKILSIMGNSPHDFLLGFNLKKQRDLFSGIKYRFNETDDIVCLLYVVNAALQNHGSLEALFKRGYKNTDANIANGLVYFVREILEVDTTPIYGKNIQPAGFLQFLPSPAGGSSCKRMNLFLRWMIRDKDIDFGIWKGIPKSKLIIPLDTHIARISKCLGFTKRKSADWKMASEITESLKKFDSEDPLKYDFALCHQGISKACSKENCKNCTLSHYT